MSIQLPLAAREFGRDGDEWPDRRISLSSANEYAVMISPRMANPVVAKKEAQFLADTVNQYADILPLFEEMKDKLHALMANGGTDDPDIPSLVGRAEEMLKSTSFDTLNDKD